MPIIFNNLSIDLTGPFTSTMFEIPVRGASCTHLEYFDLKLRPVQMQQGMGRGAVTDRQVEVPAVRQRCSAIQSSIDGFMVEVREALVQNGLTRTKSIKVGADGLWSPKAEEPDSEDEGSADAVPTAAAIETGQDVSPGEGSGGGRG
ncbi:miz zinc finger protein [Verticillium dahliae]